jgi:hypothetical protein
VALVKFLQLVHTLNIKRAFSLQKRPFLSLTILIRFKKTIKFLLQELPSQERRESSEPLLGRSLTTSTTYGGFSEEADPHYLGVAKAGAGPLNRLFFLWVNQLIRKLQGCGFNRVSGSGSGSRRKK